jgi:hypothetical protein
MSTETAKEKESGTADIHSINSPASTADPNKAASTSDASKQKHLENLRTFQDLVGIRTPPHILSSGSVPSQQLLDLEKGSKLPPGMPVSVGRPNRSLRDLIYRSEITNDGIYGRAIDEALKASIGFNISSWFINSLYVIQIFVAATITGLASYHGHEIPLTVLGAVNAVLAGLMALIKGQGLPNRLRRSRDQFQNVMKTIENTERSFARFVHMDPKKYGPLPLIPLPDPFNEFQKCQDLYDAAKRDQQASEYSICTYLSQKKIDLEALQIIPTCIRTPMSCLLFRR